MKILNFGSCNIDYVYSVPHIVAEGETLQAGELSVFAGGKGLNQSVAAQRGGAAVFHAGMIGTDGEFLRQLLQRDGVDVTYLRTESGQKTGHAMIQVSEQGENSIIVYAGTNGAIGKEYINNVLQHFGKGDILMLQNELSNTAYIIEQAAARGMKVVFNPSPIKENLKQIDLNNITYLLVNQGEARCLLGGEDAEQCLQAAKKYPGLRVVITLGQRGCIYGDAEQTLYQKAFQVKTVDTTAAGDTFAGYFVAGLAAGRPLGEILNYCAAASAIAVSQKGAAPSIPLLKEVLKKLPQLVPCQSNKNQSELLHQIKQFILADLAGVTLSAVAAELCQSYRTAGEQIKRLTGQSFTAFLQGIRLTKAAELLKTTSLPVATVAAKVGYENESFFRRLFVKRYGVTPKKYRSLP